MSDVTAQGPAAPPGQSPAASAFVLLAMITVAVALGVGFHRQLGLPVWMAAMNAVSILFGMAGMHMALARPAPAPRPAQAPASAAPVDLRRAVGKPAQAAAAPVGPAPTGAPADVDAALRATAAAAEAPARGLSDQAAQARIPVPDLPAVSADAAAPAARPAQRGGKPASAKAAAPPGSSASAAPAPPTAPRAKPTPAAPTSEPAAAPALAQPAAPAKAEAATASEKVETVQRLVRQLADQVNAQERAALRGTTSAAMTEAAISASVEALRAIAPSRPAEQRPEEPHLEPLAAGPEPADAEPAAAAARAAPTSSLGALRPGEPILAFPATPDAEGHGPIDLAGARLAALTEAIESERVDVLLEPIRDLAGEQSGHFEVSLRLRRADGDALPEMATGELIGTGLLPLLDRIRIARTAAVARRLDELGKTGSVLSEFSGESLVDIDFLSRFATAYQQHRALAAQLVLSFSQQEVRNFGTGQWALLGDMKDLGFRFALADVTSLDMDFDGLVARGFRFAKLDATVFLDGLPTDDGDLVPSRDICGYLAGTGLTLIVGHIDDEALLARILGFGVLLGQGMMFGGPRPVKPEMLDLKPVAAA